MTQVPKRRLGRTGFEVSELGLGGWRFTAEFDVPRAEAYRILDEAYAAGVNFVDTAASYGCGESQELIGRWQPGADKKLLVCTKIGLLEHTMLRNVAERAYQDEGLLSRLVEHNMHLLRQDTLDVLLVHEPDNPQWGFDRRTGDAPVTRVLERLKREGVVKAIGLGGEDKDLIADLVETDRFDVVLSFMHYDLAVQDIRERLLPAIERHDVGLIVGGPYRQGVLSKRLPLELIAEKRRKAETQKPFPGNPDYPWGYEPVVLDKLEELYALCDESGMDLPEMGLRYLLSDSAVSTVIPGPESLKDLRLNLQAAAKGPLPEDLIRRIDGLASAAAS